VPTTSVQNDEMINLTIPSLADGNPHSGWTPAGTVDGIGALDFAPLGFESDNFVGLLTATADPSLFALPDFEANFLLEQPLGPIEASFGEILPTPAPDAQASVPSYAQDGEDLFANFDWTGIIHPTDGTGPGLLMPQTMDASTLYPPAASTERDITPSEQCADMLAYFNFEPSSRNVSGASTSTVQVKEQVRAASTGFITPGAILARHYAESATPSPAPSSSPLTTPYIPPAGARRAHERRVAGSWQRSSLPGPPS
jgi:hypothetical protein